MSEAVSKVVLLHCAADRPGLGERWAERLRGCGHEVWVREPEGELDELPADVVFVGVSSAAASAGRYAATRRGCRGAILISGVAPLAELGVEAWPPTVPAQVHFAAEDRKVDHAGVESFEHALDAARARLEIHVYPGAEHLFADRESPGFDPAAAELMLARVLEFLQRCG